ncbi:tripartite tricarboxylate transporter substrate binding protein [Pseudogulbenkiania sp. MAI-1]|uniref:Bug family tripartite tricarboxylate transporter substrate binding protein n=1 Tax=Pseudogulbenkiania sp. MAI-1 TaxID=990370 RepID=UPI00045E6588|nr:tripartite tricarboxylate transporter substrate binding protein [Pseudogulbenkiania sp. MAI-1]
MKRRPFCTLLGLMVLSVGLSQGALAEDKWPSKPIRLIVPMTPGGGTDILARQIAEKIGASSKWTIVVENKPGAGGNIGLDAVAKAAPDGYTIGMGQSSNLTVNQAIYPKMPFDAQKDFAPISLVAAQPVVLVVRADSPYRKMADLVSAAKAKSGSLTMASAGAGTIGHLSGELLADRAGVKFVHVPYKGIGPALTDLLGGQVDFTFSTPASVVGMLKAGKLRALAVSSARRVNILPGIPTIAESGYQGFVTESWYGLVAPKGTPAAVVTALNAEVAKALNNPAMVEKLVAEGGQPRWTAPKDFSALIKADQDKWGSIVRQADIKLD